jgi:hypothetical protein
MSPNELSDLAPLAATLNEESNQLNQTIALLNERISALNLGITVWTETREDNESGQSFQVGFAKVGGDRPVWQLAARLSDFAGSGFYDPFPLLQASRNIRIDGLERVPELLRSVKIEAQRKIMAMREGKKLVGELGPGGAALAATEANPNSPRRTVRTSNPDIPFVTVVEPKE